MSRKALWKRPWLRYHGQGCLGVTVHAYDVGSIGTHSKLSHPV
ncbi:hypothetical protein BofuT4_uP041070.1 [Botrytis cinerea T4]|uniref:Uncharacterized protein n=1 Tax=Botryotinia fuckeliana (strain T4) TaxID=999810 RepID=G2Y1F6_BOTF4|nr:hypothetical protein BofuT4_uP041070.1 [Botrytis cinerea T4]